MDLEPALDRVLVRHSEISSRLSGAGIDAQSIVKLSKELAELDPVVDAIKKLRALQNGIAEAEHMRDDPATDAEMNQLRLGVLDVALDGADHVLERVRASRVEDAAPVAVAVDVDRGVLAQFLGVRLGPLGRAEQARLLAVPRREDDRAPRLPALLQQLAQRARFLEQRDLAGDRIVRAVDPRVVVVAAHDPLVRAASSPGCLPMTS